MRPSSLGVDRGGVGNGRVALPVNSILPFAGSPIGRPLNKTRALDGRFRRASFFDLDNPKKFSVDCEKEGRRSMPTRRPGRSVVDLNFVVVFVGECAGGYDFKVESSRAHALFVLLSLESQEVFFLSCASCGM